MAFGLRRAEGAGEKRMRPLFLAGVIGLAWFALVQGGEISNGDVPSWAVPAGVGPRLLVDFIGGWVAVSLARIVISVLRIVGYMGVQGMARVTARTGKDGQ